MALLRRRRDPRATGVSPFKAGMVGIVIIAIITFFGFTRYNPFKHPFQLKAAVRSANNLQPEHVGKGGNGAIVPPDNNIPGLSGGTYRSRDLGIDNLRDVP